LDWFASRAEFAHPQPLENKWYVTSSRNHCQRCSTGEIRPYAGNCYHGYSAASTCEFGW
jgi:hypothetical protein